MLSSDKLSFIQSLYQIGIFQFGRFKLKHGKESSFYIDFRKIISYPALLRTLAILIKNEMESTGNDLICGVPYGALPIATAVSLATEVPMVVRRKEKKAYGNAQCIEGLFFTGQHCVIIEDVITTGSSIIETAKDLEQAGLKINCFIACINRAKRSQLFSYPGKWLFTLEDIFTSLKNHISADQIHILEDLLNEEEKHAL